MLRINSKLEVIDMFNHSVLGTIQLSTCFQNRYDFVQSPYKTLTSNETLEIIKILKEWDHD